MRLVMKVRRPRLDRARASGLAICFVLGSLGFEHVFVRVSRTPAGLRAAGRSNAGSWTRTLTRMPAIRPDLAEMMGREPPGLLDEEKELQKSNFPIPADDLISLTKAWIASASDDEPTDWLAHDFRFVAPVVGPFGKDEFRDSLKSFELKKGFPDLASNYHHFRVDPFEPNRVWFSIKYTGANTGPIMGRPATGKSVESPVQAHSVTFNDKGEITKLTIGYVLDKETGNTGGLGGVFGLLHGIGYGLPFPEAQPYKPSPIYGSLMQGNRIIQDFFKANPDAKNAIQGFLTQVGK